MTTKRTYDLEEGNTIADKNGNGRISVREYVKIFSEHGIAVAEDEVRKVSQLANEHGEVEKGDFLHYAKTSDFFRQQENLLYSYFSDQLIIIDLSRIAALFISQKN